MEQNLSCIVLKSQTHWLSVASKEYRIKISPSKQNNSISDIQRKEQEFVFVEV